MQLPRIAVSLLLVGLGAVATCTAQDGPLLFSDDFAKLDAGWGKASDVKSVSDNKLLIKLGPDLAHRSLYESRQFENADVRIKVTEVAGETDQPAGVVFWASDRENCYQAIVKADGKFYVSRRSQGQLLVPVLSAVHSAVRQGVGQVNELRVATSGKTATIYVNDQQVTSFQGYPPEGGSKIGIYAESGKEGSQWAFSELRVHQGPHPAGTTGQSDDSLLFADDFETLDPAWGAASEVRSVSDRRLIIKPKESTANSYVYNGNLFEDANIRVKMANVQGGANEMAALLFWAADANNLYALRTRTDGAYQVARKVEGKWEDLTRLTASAAVKKGAGQVNDFRIATIGDAATIYINGVFITTLEGQKHPARSKIGLLAQSSATACTWAFSELRVRKSPMRPPAKDDAEGALLFTDDFRAFDPHWGEPTELQRVHGNKLLLGLAQKRQSMRLYRPSLSGNADIRVKCSLAKGSGDKSAGIVFWAVDSDNVYRAQIRSNGELLIGRLIGEKYLIPVSTDVLPGVSAGSDKTNELRVVTSGPVATVYINEKQVAAFKGFPPNGGGRIGIFANSGEEAATWEFSDLTVRRGPAPPPTTSPPDDSLLFADDFSTLDPSWSAPRDARRVEGNRLILTPQIRGTIMALHHGNLYSDADIRVKVSLVKGGQAAPAGILFWADPDKYDNYTAATLNAAGRLLLMHRQDGKWNNPKIPPKVQEAAKVGVGQVNELRVVTKGKSATIYINDEQVAAFDGSPPAGGGMIGFVVNSTQDLHTWAFSDLVVRKVQTPAEKK